MGKRVSLTELTPRPSFIASVDGPRRSPPSALSVAETELVHETIHQLRAEGHTQVIVSHSVEDVLALANRFVVMCHGRVADVVDAEEAIRPMRTELITSGTR